MFRIAGAVGCLSAVAVISGRYPILPVLLTGVLAAYGLSLWRWPNVCLFVIPAVLPAVDLAPWTGWTLVGESDLFILVTVAVLLIRNPPAVRDFVVPGFPGIVLAIAIATCVVGISIGFLSPLKVPSPSDVPYLLPGNA